MPDGGPADLSERLRAEDSRLLIEQIRLACWNILFVAIAFALGDVIFIGAPSPTVHVLNLGVCGILVVALFAIRLPKLQQWAVTFALILVAAVYFCTAAAAIVRHDATSTPFFAVIITLAIGAVFAWGIGPQLATVALASTAMAWSAYAVDGKFGALGHNAILAIAISMLLSVWVTYRRARFRFEMARQNLEHERDEARLASEERFAALVQNSSDIIVIESRDGVTRYVSPAVQRVLGYTAEEMVGNNLFNYLHSDDVPSAQSLFASLVEQPGASVNWEFRARHAAGPWIHLEATATNLLQHPRVEGVVVHARDVTDRKRVEAEETALLEVARDISGTLDLGEILERVQRRIAAVLPCDRVATFARDPSRDVFRVIGHYGVPPELHPDALTLEFPPTVEVATLLLSGQTLVINDTTTQQWLQPDVLTHFGIGTLISTPLTAHGQLIGVLAASRNDRDHRFAPNQVQLFEGIARQMALAVDTAELYRTQSEEAQISAALARVRQELISALSTPVLLDRLCQLSTAVLECDCSHTVLWDGKEDAYVAAAGYGDSPEQWESMRLLRLSPAQLAGLFARLDQDDMVEVRNSGEPRDRPMARLEQQYGVTASLYVALRRGHEIIGYQHMGYRGRTEPFTLRQHRLARGIADTASVLLENARLVEELEQVSRFKSDFLAAMSHELRTPLNVVIGYGDLLLERAFGGLANEQAETVGRMVHSARDLLDLVTATLDLSRFERRRTSPEWQEVRPAQLVDQLARETLKPPHKEALEISWNVGADLQPIQTDPLKLRMVLSNLVDNAIKFTEHGTVTVDVRASDGGVEFAVRDTGIGIPAEARALIFEPFQQVGGRSRSGGVGLGLYIVRRLLDMMGGRVGVESAVGGGSTFRVWLPSTVQADTLDQKVVQ